jgi:hypothetical protein
MSSDSPAQVSAEPWSGRKSRRRLLTFMGAGGAALFASLFSRNGAQAGHDGTNVLHLGEFNNAPPDSETGVSSNVNDFGVSFDNAHTGAQAGGIHTFSRGQLPALQANAISPAFAGVFGVSSLPPGHPPAFGKGSGNGVLGQSGSGSGVGGISDTGQGVSGNSGSGIGVVGTSETAVGVLGASGQLPLAQGPGVGVKGMSGTGTGVEAICDNGIALKARGKSAFSTAGSAVIPAGRNSAFVPNTAVTANSHISVTLASDPGPREVRWVERSPGSGFTVHLSPAPPPSRPETTLTYLIVEPA